MKYRNLLHLLFLFISFTAIAQNGQRVREKKEQIKSMKIAFITNELSLTPDEATKFWPLYNAFEDKQQAIRKQKMRGYLDRMDDNSINELSDKEASSLLIQVESTEDEIYQNKKKLFASLKGVIPSIKILKLKKAEEDFNRKLLQQYRNKKIVK